MNESKEGEEYGVCQGPHHTVGDERSNNGLGQNNSALMNGHPLGAKSFRTLFLPSTPIRSLSPQHYSHLTSECSTQELDGEL